MFTIETNAEDVVIELLSDLQQTEDSIQTNLRIAAQDAAALIASRVQHSGKNANNETMRSKSKGRIGAYSRRHGSARQKAGRQVDKIDLTFENEMMNDWQVVRVSKNEASVGFTSDEQNRKALDNERRFGPIFQPTESEKAKVIEGFVDRTLNKS